MSSDWNRGPHFPEYCLSAIGLFQAFRVNLFNKALGLAMGCFMLKTELAIQAGVCLVTCWEA